MSPEPSLGLEYFDAMPSDKFPVCVQLHFAASYLVSPRGAFTARGRTPSGMGQT